MPKVKYYAVKAGRVPGIYQSWAECQDQINGFSGACYKSFSTRVEAEKFVGDVAEETVPQCAIEEKEVVEPVNDNDPIIIYTDGACSGNHQRNNARKAGYGVHFPGRREWDISARFDLAPITNNRAELMAIYQALVKLDEEGVARDHPIVLYTDSKLAVKTLNEWIDGWRSRGWKRSAGGTVENLDIIKPLDRIYQRRRGAIRVQHVAAHVGIEGNEISDRLAVAGSQKK